MPATIPTHLITHKQTHTSAFVPLGERVRLDLDAGKTLSPGDQDYVAIAFRRTPAFSGPDMSEENIEFDDLKIRSIIRGVEYGEEEVPLTDGGAVAERDEDD